MHKKRCLNCGHMHVKDTGKVGGVGNKKKGRSRGNVRNWSCIAHCGCGRPRFV